MVFYLKIFTEVEFVHGNAPILTQCLSGKDSLFQSRIPGQKEKEVQLRLLHTHWEYGSPRFKPLLCLIEIKELNLGPFSLK